MAGRSKPSPQMRFVCLVLGAMKTKRTLGSAEVTEQDRLKGRHKPVTLPGRRIRHRFDVSDMQRAGLRCIELVERGKTPTATIVYVHGGAYISPPIAQHWDLMSALAHENNARIVAPLYQLAPEGRAATVLPAMVALHESVTAEDSRPPIWSGDSAGGGLALATALRLRDAGAEQPAHLVLFAPWLDVELNNPGIAAVLPSDPSLDVPGLQHAGRLWAGDQNTSDPDVSPANGDFQGLPGTTVIVGTRDILLQDCRDFVTKATAEGVDAELSESPGGFHVFPAATFLPESREARQLISRRLRTDALHL